MNESLGLAHFLPHADGVALFILAVLLVTTMVVGSVTLIGTIARVFDLLYTGGAYG